MLDFLWLQSFLLLSVRSAQSREGAIWARGASRDATRDPEESGEEFTRVHTHSRRRWGCGWLTFFFFLERPVEHQAKLCFTVVTITSFKPGRSHTHVPHCSVSVCHSYAKHASTQYFLFWLKVQHCKHSMMLTGSCYFPDDAYPPFVYRTACIRRVHRTRVHLVISTPLLINNNDLTLGFRGTFEKTPPWK